MSIIWGMMICLTLFSTTQEKHYEWQGPYENTEKITVMFIERKPPGSY